MIIHLGLPLLAGSSSLPGSKRGPRMMLPYLALLRVGFALPPLLPDGAVRSYRTLSPLPQERTQAAVCFLWHFPEVAPAGRYPVPCPVQPGLSSADIKPVAIIRATPQRQS